MRILIISGVADDTLQPLTEHHPKIMTSIHGEPFIHYLLSLYKKHDIVLSGSDRMSFVKSWCKKNDYWLEYVDEPFSLNSGGSLIHAKPFLENNRHFAVVVGTSYLATDIVSAYQRMEGEAGSVYAVDKIDGVEKPAGIYFFKKSYLQYLDGLERSKNFTRLTIEHLLTSTPHKKIHVKEKFLDINSHQGLRYAKTTKFMEKTHAHLQKQSAS